MKRTTTIALALLLAVGMAAMPLAAADLGTAANVQDDEDDEGVAPGEQLAGVVGVQEAELNGELAERTYGITVAQAATDEAKADVVNETLEDVEDRIADLEDRSEELNDAYEAGEISQGQYQAEMAAVAAEKETAERLAHGTAATASEMENPEAHGIDVTAIQTLAENASELGGPDVAEIAQSIAGEYVGQPVDPDREPGAPIELPETAADAPTDDAGDAQSDGAGEANAPADHGADETDAPADDETDDDQSSDAGNR